MHNHGVLHVYILNKMTVIFCSAYLCFHFVCAGYCFNRLSGAFLLELRRRMLNSRHLESDTLMRLIARCADGPRNKLNANNKSCAKHSNIIGLEEVCLFETNVLIVLQFQLCTHLHTTLTPLFRLINECDGICEMTSVRFNIHDRRTANTQNDGDLFVKVFEESNNNNEEADDSIWYEYYCNIVHILQYTARNPLCR
jgi:hypothetical protein